MSPCLKTKVMFPERKTFCPGLFSSPYELMDRIEVLSQRKKSMRSWAVKNIGTQSALNKLEVIQHKSVPHDLNTWIMKSKYEDNLNSISMSSAEWFLGEFMLEFASNF